MEAETKTMTDDEIDGLIADPAKIESHEQALEIIEVLDHEIADIQAQVDAAQIEANVRPLPHARQQWLQRATYACAMRKNERHKVMQRDKEIRGTKNHGGSPKDPEKTKLGVLKNQRFIEEAQTKKAAKLAEVERQKTEQMRLAQAKRVQHHFMNIAKLKLDAATYSEICSAATMLATASAISTTHP